MQDDAFSLNIRNLKLLFDRNQDIKQIDLANKRGSIGVSSQKFTFVKHNPIKEQIQNFKAFQRSGQWNGKIAFSRFQGIFKMEYWGQFEEGLHQITGLTKVIFSETKLSRLHLRLLQSLIQWVEPTEISLKFFHNELDDEDLDEFLIKGLLPTLGHKIHSVQVVSNPGIFKGRFVSQLQRQLDRMSHSSQKYRFHFIKNKEYQSIGFIRLLKVTEQEIQDAQILKLQISLEKTYFYKFYLQDCFTLNNSRAFQHLIESNYHEDKLEQIESLDVGKCELGSQFIFNKMCKMISTSKGLLTLGLQNINFLDLFDIVKSLMGDRYDQFRINHINIAENRQMTQTAMKVMVDDLLSKSIKTINLSQILNGGPSVVTIMIDFIDSLMRRNNLYNKKMIQKQFIPKSTLKRLDLSTVNNLNRHDITRDFLLATVFNEFSVCKELIFQNLDYGRLKAYLEALSQFEEHINQQKDKYPFYQEFIPKLSILVMGMYNQITEKNTIESLFERFFFTKSTDLLQIQKIILQFSFEFFEWEEAMNNFLLRLNGVYEQEPTIQFTLKHITLMKSVADKNSILSLMFQNVLFSRHFSIESFILIKLKKFTKEDSGKFFSCAEQFFNSIPLGNYCSLKTLTLQGIQGTGIDALKLVEIMIFSDKVQIEELILKKFELDCTDESITSLNQKSQDWNNKLTLTKLNIGKFSKSRHDIECILIEAMVIHPMSQVRDLSLQTLVIQESLAILKQKLQKAQEKGHTPMIYLKSLTLNKFVDYTEDQWELFSDVFIYANDTSISSIELKNIIISSAMVQGIRKSITKKQQYITENNIIPLGSSFCLQTIKFNKCLFQDDLFSLICLTQQRSFQTLHIRQCKGFDTAIKIFKTTYESNEEFKDILNFQIHDLLLDGTNFDSMELLDWFFRTIILNKKTQQLKRLSMQRCNLKDSHFELISSILMEIKNYNLEGWHKNYFRLHEFNFNYNRCINYENWKRFFDILFSIKSGVAEEKEIDQGDFEIQQQQKESIFQGKVNKKYDICEEIKYFIVEKRLSIPQKILANPSTYVITPPIQLKRLELEVCFSIESSKCKQRLYDRILRSLVYFKNSNLKELQLIRVDLPLFLISSQDCFNHATYDVSLKQLELIEVRNCSDISVSTLAKLYITNKQINLEGLIVDQMDKGNFYQNLAESVKESLIEGKTCSLKLLSLKNVLSNLNIEETLYFFKTVVFNRQVPLSSIELSVNETSLESDEKLLQSISEHLIEQNYSCPLKTFSIIGETYFPETQATLIRLFPILIQGVLIKLEKLSISNDQNLTLCQLFENLDESDKQVNFTIIDLTLDFYMKMSLAEFKFFYYVRPKLQALKLGKIAKEFGSPQEINEFLKSNDSEITQMKRFKTPCMINLEFLQNESQGKQLMEKFIFGPAFKWDKVTLKGDRSFIYLQEISYANTCLFGGSLTRHLRYLSIDQTLQQDESPIINKDNLRIIGDQLIYNEMSILEELFLKRCNLDSAGIIGLTSCAQAFRDKIHQLKRQQKTNLSLKRLQIYSSLLNMDESAELLNKDIFFFEYITIEQIEIVFCQWNDNMSISQCNYGLAWLKFQNLYKRNRPHFFIKLIDLGQNEFVQSQKAWFLLCDTFIFSDKTPNLEVLNIHFMGLKDLQVDWICQKADEYFREKPFYYVHPLKRINFQDNTALSARGWKEITERFFFSKHVNLQELNLMYTMLDSQEKLNAVYQGGYKKAQKHKSKKIPLHTLISLNASLKQIFHDIMCRRPIDYKPIKDQSQEIDQSYLQEGLIYGYPDSFGLRTSLMTKNIYQSEYIISNELWQNEIDTRFSEYHLDIMCGLLRPLSELFDKNPDYYCGHFPIDLTSCDELCTIFKYELITGDPYPYQLFFTTEACKFYLQPSCSVRVINFIQTNHINTEQITQTQLLGIWNLVKSTKTSLDVVYIDYKLDDDLVDAMIHQGYSERDIINLVRLFPPSSIRLQDILTLQALKAIYSIMYDNHQFNYANILYDKDNFLNVGIGYSLREFVYRSNPSGFIQRHLKPIFYHLFNLFVYEDTKYSFTEQIKDLNEFLSKQRRYFIILTLLTIIFYIICIFGPYGFQHYYIGDDSFDIVCYDGMTSVGIYCFLVFAVFSFTAEAYLYWGVSQIIPNHIKGLIDSDTDIGNFKIDQNDHEPNNKGKTIPDQNNDQFLLEHKKSSSQALDPKSDEKINLMSTGNNIISQRHIHEQINQNNHLRQNAFQNMPNKMIKMMKIFAQSKSGRMLGYIKDLGIGQLAKFHLYTDVNFIMTCYYCRLNGLAVLALIVTSLNIAYQLYALFKFILTQCYQSSSKAKLLSTQYINDFYEISSVGKNIALANILDSVAPYNVTAITNNTITRKLFPQLAGKSMSNKVKVNKLIDKQGYIVKFALEDVPQIILQLYFVIYRAFHPLRDPSLSYVVVFQPSGSLTTAIYLTIINTCVSLIVSFIQQKDNNNMKRFMSIRPSILSQAHFDQLAEEKTKSFMTNQLAFVEKEFKIFKALTGDCGRIQTKRDDDGEELINI